MITQNGRSKLCILQNTRKTIFAKIQIQRSKEIFFLFLEFLYVISGGSNCPFICLNKLQTGMLRSKQLIELIFKYSDTIFKIIVGTYQRSTKNDIVISVKNIPKTMFKAVVQEKKIEFVQ